jgi:hypothetical protein
MADEGLGSMAGRWLKAKAKELTTSDQQERRHADREADLVEHQAQESAAERAFFTALPGLKDMKDRQEAAESDRERARSEQHEAELRSRGLAGVSLRARGVFDGDLVGHLPAVAEVRPPESEDPDADPDDEWADPYATQPTLWVQLASLADQRPEIGGHRLREWTFAVPGFTGDGTYDLVAVHHAREAVNAAPDYLEWVLSVDEAEDDFSFYPDAGPATVTVADGGKALDVTMTLGSSAGDLTLTAAIRLP